MKMKEVRRLPLGFGPVQVPEVPQMAKVEAIEVCFETKPELLADLILPAGTELTSSVVHVFFHKYNGCNLLAGRGYNSVIVAFDCRRNGKDGLYIAIRLTNDMFTMIDGRYGDYGFPDMYAELLDPVLRGDTTYCYATEYEYRFMELFASAFEPLSDEGLEQLKKQRRHTNWFTDEHEAVIVTRVDAAQQGAGSVRFTTADWFDAPGLFRFANFMEGLPVVTALGALRWTGAMEIGLGGEL